ncbi:BZ3500_MvSof-1268-A1-R1_Chr4-3g07364 [Microbotryum saponariae]|uniref:[histone H3]-trimethyl-L-lysine(4) demethylase n=1 Tax=Microbotryum saponariae TaxID=289078 RepID=A0A2X0NMP3_9BASI|nr:BZ3500_MvSof-1268-A1-R1_Chr4-3g07364 [Microbotryum saponariae]SDA07027.1 BZ3501_MvSof-1269-A2-R1_Chr4-2g07073 [Microbotryum saponariae]
MSRFGYARPRETFVSSLDIKLDDSTRFGPQPGSASVDPSGLASGAEGATSTDHNAHGARPGSSKGPTSPLPSHDSATASQSFADPSSSAATMSTNGSAAASGAAPPAAALAAGGAAGGRASKNHALAALAMAKEQAQALSVIVSPVKASDSNASASTGAAIGSASFYGGGTSSNGAGPSGGVGACAARSGSHPGPAQSENGAGSDNDDAVSNSTSHDAHHSSGPSRSKNPVRKYTAELPRAPPLDFSTIRTHAPRLPNPPARPRSRPARMFGLQHAPVFHPTIEEFAKPMEYIEKIALEAREWGICKVVPPEGWRPPFALNTEVSLGRTYYKSTEYSTNMSSRFVTHSPQMQTFRFKTRLQQLNSMEATARASLNFLEQLYLFHRQQGSVGIHIPTIAGKPIDMFKLKREVTMLGGYHAVSSQRKWSYVGKSMGYNTSLNNTICSQIKTSYSKIILPFEDYVNRVKQSGGTPPPDPSAVNVDAATNPFEAAASATSTIPVNGVAAEEVPATNGANPAEGSVADSVIASASEMFNAVMQETTAAAQAQGKASAENGSDVKMGGPSSSESPKKKASENETPGEACEICSKHKEPDRIVLCDGCDHGFHLDCLSPPLAEVPKSQFFCEACLLQNGADYGFDEGEEHSLYSFQKRADAFKRKWLLEHPMPKEKARAKDFTPAKGYAYVNAQGEAVEPPPVDEFTEQIAVEDHFEREFWRLVESPHETVEIEYGADVNHTNDGGGLPNLEIHSSDPYSRDGWNLNNLPILAGSLLRYIKSDISGMTIPWIYVGMVFSTFAWHKEDHYTYSVLAFISINYHHFGDTKTWYGIPGDDDEKLEAAMKLAAPELFDQHPDLMWQLVTLMSPGRLKKHGVRVCACDQRPNEFVITFPRAYHSGFNHGFNFNEAVNFALPDWLPTGIACVERYRLIGKNPVFSHDELLVTISQHEKGPRASRWLLPSYREMVERELAGREKLRRLLPGLIQGVDPTELDEEEYQCAQCKVLCYLSQVLSHDMEQVACLDHYQSITNVDAEHPLQLRLKFSDETLSSMLVRVKQRSDKAGKLPMDVLIGPIETATPVASTDLRTTGRKRKPSALALEAAESEDVMSLSGEISTPPNGRAAQRARMETFQPVLEVPQPMATV